MTIAFQWVRTVLSTGFLLAIGSGCAADDASVSEGGARVVYLAAEGQAPVEVGIYDERTQTLEIALADSDLAGGSVEGPDLFFYLDPDTTFGDVDLPIDGPVEVSLTDRIGAVTTVELTVGPVDPSALSTLDLISCRRTSHLCVHLISLNDTRCKDRYSCSNGSTYTYWWDCDCG